MILRLMYAIALALVMANPAWSAGVGASTAEDYARQYLDGLGASRYTLTPIQDSYVTASFPSFDFFEVVFQQYPVATIPPEGLNPSDIVVVQGDKVFALIDSDALKTFFLYTVAPVADGNSAANAGESWLRLTEVFSQDGFFTFSDPMVTVFGSFEGGLVVFGAVDVIAGGDGRILMTMDFDSDGQLTDVFEDRNVQPGSRPI